MHRRSLLPVFALLLAPAAARADAKTADEAPMRAPAHVLAVDAYAGLAGYGTFAGGYAGGLEIAGHGERLAWSAFVDGTYGADGREVGVGASFGEVVGALGPFELQAHLMAGEHGYSDVHGIASTYGSVVPAVRGCSGLPGAGGKSPFLGLRLGVATRARPGTRVLAGLWIDASDDLVHTTETLSGTVLCGSVYGAPTQETRNIPATIGGWRLGVSFRFGWSMGA